MLCNDPLCTMFNRFLNKEGRCDGKRLFVATDQSKILQLLISRRNKAQRIFGDIQNRLDNFSIDVCISNESNKISSLYREENKLHNKG